MEELISMGKMSRLLFGGEKNLFRTSRLFRQKKKRKKKKYGTDNPFEVHGIFRNVKFF